jgi:predicted transcriptional regulator
MSDRELVLDAVREMPANLSIRQIVDELLLLDEVKDRLAKSERGAPGVPHEDVVKSLESWITK